MKLSPLELAVLCELPGPGTAFCPRYGHCAKRLAYKIFGALAPVVGTRGEVLRVIARFRAKKWIVGWIDHACAKGETGRFGLTAIGYEEVNRIFETQALPDVENSPLVFKRRPRRQHKTG